MKILIKNATLISMSSKREKIEKNIDIKIEENKIVQIGKNIDEIGIDKVIDATNKVVMPGLINTHAHVPMSIFRETVDGYNMQEWLSEKIWPMEDKLTSEDVYYASYLSFIEMIQTGTTTINDMYYMTESIVKAAVDAKIRLQTTRTLTELQENIDGQKRIDELKEILNKYKGKYNNISLNIGFHGLYTSNKMYTKKCAEIAKNENLAIHMHFCENTNEVEDITRIYNKKPIDILIDEFKDIKTILAHCVKLSKEDIEKLKSMKDVSISHCPVSNLKLGCGIANISEMVKQGINVSLGTDGQGSGSSLDLFEAMKFTALLQKGKEENPMLLPAYEVIKMATINGAKALGMDEQIGSIDIDKIADIIIIDLDNTITQPINDIFSEIVYNVKGSNVETTIIDGNILMENRKLNVNEKDIFNKCTEIIERIKD